MLQSLHSKVTELKKYVIAVLVQGRSSAGKIINLQQALYIHDYSPHQVEQG
jgi:hypothetical protein